MSDKPEETKDKPTISETLNRFMLKVKYSFYSTLVFFLFANPETFRVVQQLVGNTMSITTGAGVPTPFGFFLHTGLFFVTMLGLMLIPSY
jgi:hypothetical protein